MVPKAFSSQTGAGQAGGHDQAVGSATRLRAAAEALLRQRLEGFLKEGFTSTDRPELSLDQRAPATVFLGPHIPESGAVPKCVHNKSLCFWGIISSILNLVDNK